MSVVPRPSAPGRVLLAVLLVPALGGCLSVSWGRTNRDEPLPQERMAELAPGRTTLGECLATFGAPERVEEHPVAGGEGAVLLWGWLDERDLGLSVSVPVSDQNSVNFDYRTIDARTRGLVLFFDERWILAEWRSGLLSEVAADVRPRPALVEEDG